MSCFKPSHAEEILFSCLTSCLSLTGFFPLLVRTIHFQPFSATSHFIKTLSRALHIKAF